MNSSIKFKFNFIFIFSNTNTKHINVTRASVYKLYKKKILNID